MSVIESLVLLIYFIVIAVTVLNGTQYIFNDKQLKKTNNAKYRNQDINTVS